jgi:phospholipid/cholesterol/gamma-HCH transport system permease protein
MLLFLSQVLGALFKRESWDGKEIFRLIVTLGVDSIGLIFLASCTAGILVTRELGWHMYQALNSVDMVPGFTAQFVLRELGIIIPCILFASKVGSAIAAEVSSMKVTEQIDALVLMGIHPMSHLVVPRLIACLISGTCLTLIAIFVTLMCAMIVAVSSFKFSFLQYANTVAHFVKPVDLCLGVFKGALYGGLIPLIACYNGLNCKLGAQEVGIATTNSVLYSKFVIVILDFIITYIFAVTYG